MPEIKLDLTGGPQDDLYPLISIPDWDPQSWSLERSAGHSVGISTTDAGVMVSTTGSHAQAVYTSAASVSP